MIDMLSIKGRLMVLKTMRYGGLILIFYRSLVKFDKDRWMLALIISLIMISAVNDYLRAKLKYSKGIHSIWFSISFILSNIFSSFIMTVNYCDGVELYNITLIVDLLFDIELPGFLLAANFILYAIPFKINVEPDLIRGLSDIFLNYSLRFIVILIMRSIFIEKEKAKRLNDELVSANQKLKEYSETIEELTVSKERTRIAQELHDSIGHSLIALNMNLEYAQNVIDLKPEKAKDVIVRSHNMAKESIVKLREVVSVLREDTKIINLGEAINKLFENFYNENYEFNLSMYDSIEEEQPKVKNCIYKTIMEGITNGIKHGGAANFNILIAKEQGSILLTVSNDGIGCKDVVRSSGTNGIEKRITELGGTVEFVSENEVGFEIKASIPVGGDKL